MLSTSIWIQNVGYEQNTVQFYLYKTLRDNSNVYSQNRHVTAQVLGLWWGLTVKRHGELFGEGKKFSSFTVVVVTRIWTFFSKLTKLQM